MSGVVAITMAGLGSRFTKAGYDRPKYEIEALGRPLFDWSMVSLEAYRQAGWSFRFAVRSGLGAPDYLTARCKVLGIEVDGIVELDHLTDGQATTALELIASADAQRPVAVFNIDTYVAPGAMVPPDPATCAGHVPCFPGPGNGWSFARTDADGRVVELREKERISDHATVGLYWFDSVARYRQVYDTYFRTAGEEKGERYIAPMYNQIIADGDRVSISQLALEDVGMLGTPEQLDSFVASPPPSALAWMQRR
ncbi:glycosyltransferase family 2 protein [Roseibium sediminicola]|uniref:Glycosyltransferase family 2 protein n=1 Tax=Roseibium sediminicola TaxID=2933272 RepID=A0ABT0H3N2_9HYPH|nr:glycosyltransferase family 2 protein [Roseibium sp. CAU 1639]MCK7616080.1 glycosyltransferase family 2 protein [Roseibium sp. CAU 1639]